MQNNGKNIATTKVNQMLKTALQEKSRKDFLKKYKNIVMPLLLCWRLKTIRILIRYMLQWKIFLDYTAFSHGSGPLKTLAHFKLWLFLLWVCWSLDLSPSLAPTVYFKNGVHVFYINTILKEDSEFGTFSCFFLN